MTPEIKALVAWLEWDGDDADAFWKSVKTKCHEAAAALKEQAGEIAQLKAAVFRAEARCCICADLTAQRDTLRAEVAALRQFMHNHPEGP